MSDLKLTHLIFDLFLILSKGQANRKKSIEVYKTKWKIKIDQDLGLIAKDQSWEFGLSNLEN